MKKLFDSVNRKKAFLVVGSIFIFMAGTFLTLGIQGKIKNLQNINDGVQTCVSRVGQSYNAHLLQKNGKFLEQNFFSTTEECFGEVISLVEANVPKSKSDLLHGVNDLSSKASWLHAKFGKKIINLAQDTDLQQDNENLSEYYNQIETLKFEILEKNQKTIDRLSQSGLYFQIALVLSSVLLVMFGVWQFSYLRRKKQTSVQIEHEAELELNADDFVQERASKIIHQALNEFNFEYCDKLFTKMQSNVVVAEKQTVETRVVQPSINLTLPNVTKMTAENNKNQTYEVNLQVITSNVLKVLSDTIAQYDAEIDFNISEDIFVMGVEEDYQYLLYNVLKLFLSNKMNVDGIKKISSRTKKLGGTLLLELEDNTVGYGQFSQNDKPIEMILCEEIAADLGIGLQFTTQYDSNRDVIGGKTQLILRLASKSVATYIPKQLVSLKKGSKKEILKSFGL